MSNLVADILDSAAALIEREGFWKGAEGGEGVSYAENDSADCTCAGLAIVHVTEDHLPGDYAAQGGVSREAYRALLDYLGIEDREQADGTPSLFDVARWNDHQDRTKDEVLLALRSTAVKVRSEA